MAVDAHHLNLFPSSYLLTNRDNMIMAANTMDSQQNQYNLQSMPYLSPVMPMYTATGSESGVTFNNIPTSSPATTSMAATTAAPISRKRARDTPVSFLGEDISAHVHQQMLDIDRVIVHHAEKVRAELAERRRRFARQIMAAVEQKVAKRLKHKEEEIERVSKLNWQLEERMKTLYIENQIWREMAQSNEATANALRGNLEAVLEAHASTGGGARVPEDDSESCCCGENEVAMTPPSRACRCCGNSEAVVLLLPCRHLCCCVACGAAVQECPVCGCNKNDSVGVNLS